MSNIPENKLKSRQFRLMQPLEVRTEEDKSGSYIVTGYAMKYEPYILWEDEEGPIYEEFRKEAFEGVDISDVIMLYDHQGRVFCRTSNETLEIGFDDIGMYIVANLGTTARSKELYEDIKSGLITKMSWSFRPGDFVYEKDTKTIVHYTIKKIYDVSAVGIPANNDTEINARNFIDGVISEIKTERSKVQQHRRKIAILKIKLERENNE